MTKPLVRVCFVLLAINVFTYQHRGEGKVVTNSIGRISKPYVSKARKRSHRNNNNKDISRNDSLRKVNITFDSMFMDYPFEKNHRCQYSWIPSRVPIVPLVSYGWREIVQNPSIREVFFDERGYKYCNNGQNEEWSSLLTDNSSLYFRYSPRDKVCTYPPLSKEVVIQKLKGKWIHMVGDSLTRDTYYDILEYLGLQSGCARVKTHHNLHHVYHCSHANNDYDKDTTVGVKSPSHIFLSFGFNMGDLCTNDVFQLHDTPTEASFPPYPDAIIWSSGLWHTQRSTHYLVSKLKTSNPITIDEKELNQFRNGLACLGEESEKRPKTKFIFRMTTPYVQPKYYLKKYSNRFIHHSPLHYQHNAEGLQILWKLYNWTVLDTWTMLRNRQDLTADGGHYTGVGSRTITYQMLEMLVYDTPSKVNIENFL